MSKTGTLFLEGNSIFHRMDGSVKMLLFVVWTITTFMFIDLRVNLVLIVLGILSMWLAHIPFKKISLLLYAVIIFNLINSLFILLITPQYGSELTGTYTDFLNIGYNVVTVETLFYTLTLSLKYMAIFPITVVFIFTTHPSRFAYSLNRIGVPYKIAYSVNIAFRYIPTIQKEYQTILNAQRARGVAIGKGAGSLMQRMKNFIMTAIPLVVTSLSKIEMISNAMELRGFGLHNKRTWYYTKKLEQIDYIVITLSLLLFILAIVLKLTVLKGFWYPF